MKEQDKDSLENFFQEGAQKYHIEFEEGDWRKLEAQLDREMPVAFSFRTFLKKYWPYAFLLLIIPATWYTYSSLSRQEPPAQAVDAKGPGSNGKSEIGDIDGQGQVVARKSGNQTLNLLDPESSESEKTLSDTETAVRDVDSKQEAERQEHQPKDEQYSITNIVHVDGESGADLMATSGVENMASSQEIEDNNAELSGDHLQSMKVTKEMTSLSRAGLPESKRISNSDEIERVIVRPISEEAQERGDPDNERKVSFYAGVGFSPDFSTVGLGNFIAPGFRWNGMLELGFAKRFSVNTGVVWIKNKYEAYGEDYHAPPGYWHNGIEPEEAYGECVMIDIPLNLRYDIFKKDRHRIFLSGGASTYFVMKEDYYFHYQSDDPELPTYWGTDKTTIYPFGIINISFGYQYQVGRRGAIQVEPFIKLPTGGIGWGNVDLHTVGMYFMYKYRIGR